MGLQVWLPLNGNLNNQGLTDIAFTNTGATVDNNGKIGSCYYFSSQSLYNTNFNWTSTNWSICYWVKYTSLPSSSNFYQLTLNGSTSSDYTFMLGGYSSNGTTGVFRCNMTGDCGTINTGVWYHVCATYNGTSCKIYVNGTLLKTFNITVNTGKKHLVINGRANNTAGTSFVGTSGVCYLNDVRIYDNCLSDKEVKEISKGLILHYSLDRNGWGQDNLAHNTYGLSPFSTSQVEFKAYDVGVLDVTDGETITISFFLDMTIATAASSGYLQVYNTNYKGPHQIVAVNVLAGRKLVVGEDIHERISFTTTINNRSGANRNTDVLEFYSNYNTENEIFISNIKVERGTKATQWSPNPSDTLYTIMGIGNAVEYDISGYQNNGIKVNSFTYDTNTAKYKVSTVFDGNTAAIQTPNLKTLISDSNYTISVWVNKAVIGTKNYQTIYGGPSGFELEARSSSSTSPLFRIHNWGGGTTAYEFNKWNHFCFVHNSTESKLYVNGILKITGTSVAIPSGDYFIGAWKTATQQNFDGKMSDFRIYSTALSADDVLDLYNNKL